MQNTNNMISRNDRELSLGALCKIAGTCDRELVERLVAGHYGLEALSEEESAALCGELQVSQEEVANTRTALQDILGCDPALFAFGGELDVAAAVERCAKEGVEPCGFGVSARAVAEEVTGFIKAGKFAKVVNRINNFRGSDEEKTALALVLRDYLAFYDALPPETPAKFKPKPSVVIGIVKGMCTLLADAAKTRLDAAFLLCAENEEFYHAGESLDAYGNEYMHYPRIIRETRDTALLIRTVVRAAELARATGNAMWAERALEELAGTGNPVALFNLGLYAFLVTHDNQRAFEVFARAAEAGCPEANHLLACSAAACGMPEEKVEEYLALDAGSYSHHSQNDLAVRLLAAGREGAVQKAMELFAKAADAGDKVAMYNRALLVLQTGGTAEETRRAQDMVVRLRKSGRPEFAPVEAGPVNESDCDVDLPWLPAEKSVF